MHKLWPKQFRMGPITFEYPLNLMDKTGKMTQNSEKQLSLKNDQLKHYRDYQPEILTWQLLKHLESGNQSFQLFTRIAEFDQLSLLENFLVLKLSFSQVAFFILPENSREERA